MAVAATEACELTFCYAACARIAQLPVGVRELQAELVALARLSAVMDTARNKYRFGGWCAMSRPLWFSIVFIFGGGSEVLWLGCRGLPVLINSAFIKPTSV